MPGELRYAVKFVGYSAYVIARKYGRDDEYLVADLNCVCGVACMYADGGFVVVPKRIDLKPFLESLPKLATELQEALLRQRNRELSQQTTGVAERGAADEVRVSCGPNTVWVAPGTVINRFIRQLTERFIEIERILEQTEEIGLRIKRRPYFEYLADIDFKTEICPVEIHGFALSVDERMIFYPRYKAGLVKRQGYDLFEFFFQPDLLAEHKRPDLVQADVRDLTGKEFAFLRMAEMVVMLNLDLPQA